MIVGDLDEHDNGEASCEVDHPAVGHVGALIGQEPGELIDQPGAIVSNGGENEGCHAAIIRQMCSDCGHSSLVIGLWGSRHQVLVTGVAGW